MPSPFRLYGACALALPLALGAFAAACSDSPAPVDGETTAQALTNPDGAWPILNGQSLLVAPVVTEVDGGEDPNNLGQAALAGFSLESVMKQVVATGAQGSGQTAKELYKSLVGTLAQPPCTGQINGWTVFCPSPESVLSTLDPFACEADGGAICSSLFTPIALVNRLDLAPADGANCGQYRIVFALTQKVVDNVNAFFLNFEAVLPNPQPSLGLRACLPVAQFWNDLSAPGISAQKFATQLKQFYFDGLPATATSPAFAPVIQAQNYGIGAPGNSNTGQLRVNMNSGSVADGPNEWQLREFRLGQSCGGGSCVLVPTNTFVQDNPFGALFAVNAPDGGAAFQAELLTQVQSLAADDLNLISMATPDFANAGQSNEQGSDNDYATMAGLKGGTPNKALVANIQQVLTEMGSSLTPRNIIDRATTQSCAGCHTLSADVNVGGADGGLVWPRSTEFSQVTHGGGQSPALTQVFLPYRAKVLASFLASNGTSGSGDGTRTLGGGLVGSSN